MLGEILKTLEEHQDKPTKSVPNKAPNKVPNKLKDIYPEIPETAWQVYSAINQNANATNSELSELLSISDRMIRKHILLLKAKGLIERIGARKNGYWQIIQSKNDS